jgi:hypothetical protein
VEFAVYSRAIVMIAVLHVRPHLYVEELLY